MNTPIGHKPPGVIPEPTKVKMKAVLIEWSFCCRTEPHIIIYAWWWVSIRLYRNGFHPTLVCPGFHKPYIAQLARMHECDGVGIMFIAVLPLPHLYHAVVFFLRCFHQLAFNNGIAYRLFYIYVFSRRARFCHDVAMPVVGGSYDDRVDVFVVKQPPVVFVR